MHLYRIDIYSMAADGSIMGIHASEYADTPEKVLSIMDKWEAIRATAAAPAVEDGEDVEPADPITYQAYKAIIKVARYTDINIAQFKAMYK